MTSEERDRVVTLLRESSDALLSIVEPLTDAQWSFRDGPERWSVGEVVEHLAVAEQSLFGRVEAALAASVNPDWKTATAGKTERLERLLLDRSDVREAPPGSRPTGTALRAEVLRQYRNTRAVTLSFAAETQAPLDQHTQDHVRPIYGTLSAYQWLLFIPLHNLRHNQQIAEIVATPDFPA